VRIIHGITFSTIQPADVPTWEMQQLAHAAAFLTAVTPPFYLSDVHKDGCCIDGLWYTVKLTASSTVAVSFSTRCADSCAPYHAYHRHHEYSWCLWCIHAITGPPTVSNFTTHKDADAVRCATVRNRPLFHCPALRSRTAASWTEADGSGRHSGCEIRGRMRVIHRIINFCITATLKTGGAYYTQVRIISETLR